MTSYEGHPPVDAADPVLEPIPLVQSYPLHENCLSSTTGAANVAEVKARATVTREARVGQSILQEGVEDVCVAPRTTQGGERSCYILIRTRFMALRPSEHAYARDVGWVRVKRGIPHLRSLRHNFRHHAYNICDGWQTAMAAFWTTGLPCWPEKVLARFPLILTPPQVAIQVPLRQPSSQPASQPQRSSQRSREAQVIGERSCERWRRARRSLSECYTQ